MNVALAQPIERRAASARDLITELELLARIASRRPGLSVQVGPPGCTWAFDWQNDVVVVNPDHIREFAPDVCRGLILHEAAHAAITRLHDLLARPLLTRLMPLLNTIEDIRIETWMQRRFPGAVSWIRAYNDALFGFLRETPLGRSRQVQFLRTLLEMWWFGEAPVGLLPEVMDAIGSCRGTVARAAACQPPSHHDEPAIRESQRAMWELVRSQVVPVWERLVELDRREGIDALADREVVHFARVTGQSHPGHRESRPGNPVRGISETLRTDGSEEYLAAWRRVAGLSDAVGDSLIRSLLPVRRLRWSAGHASGSRLDLRRAVQRETDAQAYCSLWMRPVLPSRHEAAVALLIDRSGSMTGQGLMQPAFDGLVLFLEVCRRVGVPAAAWSFAKECREEVSWDRQIDETVRRRIGGVMRSAGGQTAMAQALVRVSDAIHRRQADTKILFVLSDGLPNDIPSTRSAITRLEASGILPIGLGLGMGTTGLAQLFPVSEVNLPASRIPSSVARLLKERLGVPE